MKTVTVLLLMGMAFSVTGCLGLAEPRDLAARKPFLETTVKSNPDEVLKACFGDWKNGPYRNGVSAWIQISMTEVHYLADIMPIPTGSQITLFKAKWLDSHSLNGSIADVEAYRNATQEGKREIEKLHLDLGMIALRECLKKLQ